MRIGGVPLSLSTVVLLNWPNVSCHIWVNNSRSHSDHLSPVSILGLWEQGRFGGAKLPHWTQSRRTDTNRRLSQITDWLELAVHAVMGYATEVDGSWPTF